MGFLLIEDPIPTVAALGSMATQGGPWAVRRLSVTRGVTYDVLPALFELVASRLFFSDGSLNESSAALHDYRLIAETATTTHAFGRTFPRYKVFERVPGVSLVVEGAAPSRAVQITIPMTSATGRRFSWTAVALADAGGRSVIRVPYATGPNGLTFAEPMVVSDGLHVRSLRIAETSLRSAETVRVSLGGEAGGFASP